VVTPLAADGPGGPDGGLVRSEYEHAEGDSLRNTPQERDRATEGRHETRCRMWEMTFRGQQAGDNVMCTHTGRILMVAALMMALVAGGAAAQVKTTAGLVQGTAVANGAIRVFSGIPYAAPPVGALRWQAPQAVAPWQGVRDATKAGPGCMQGTVFGDIVLPELSEDCLTLNIHTPARTAEDRLPVMVWIHGGGFQAGAGSEPRHDGQAFARNGIVLVTINYRLGVFGFLVHPELTRESGRHASGNYGMLDQVASLRWVQDNIAAFGGDPRNVTIFGESAGSFAVSALMASPLSQGLFHKAIGESGAFFTVGAGTLAFTPLADGEQQGVAFATSIGADSLAALRAQPAQAVLDGATKSRLRFAPNVDGYFLMEDVHAAYAAGKHSQIPLLAGWNADEIRAAVTLRPQKPTVQSFTEETRKRFGAQGDGILKTYPAGSDAEAIESSAALASDMFIGYATWKWIEMHAQSGRLPVYRYSFDRKIPVPPDNKVNGVSATSADIGARHAGEIEYVFGTLDLSLPKVPWEPADRKLSETMTAYWANFARTGDPNGAGLPVWPRYDENSRRRVLHLGDTIGDAPDMHRPRYEAIDAYVATQRAPKAP
jgi:para-nitrobenzyl esterase